MRIPSFIYLLLFFLLVMNLQGQNKLVFKGQVSGFSNYSPGYHHNILVGGRYIPELDYTIPIDSVKKIDFEVSANLYGTASFFPSDSAQYNANLTPYRMWARYSGKQFELRAGLQKIDFGSATLLRPMQWFNQIDPRDPLRLTNGVYGVLGRYYFLNNANVWLWALYRNEKPRGFDVIETNKKFPEYGGRVQYPVRKGEIAVSYHHRTANAQIFLPTPDLAQIPENRFGLDGKWDLGVGLWFEATHTIKHKSIGALTNQSLFNLGTDYTFGIGNGLNIVVEHLLMSYDEKPLAFQNPTNITATTFSYPLGLFDNLSLIFYHNWTAKNSAVFVNYAHQFKKMTGYIMPYYNPKVQQGIQQNQLLNTTSGPGIRLMLVYNH